MPYQISIVSNKTKLNINNYQDILTYLFLSITFLIFIVSNDSKDFFIELF